MRDSVLLAGMKNKKKKIYLIRGGNATLNLMAYHNTTTKVLLRLDGVPHDQSPATFPTVSMSHKAFARKQCLRLRKHT